MTTTHKNLIDGIMLLLLSLLTYISSAILTDFSQPPIEDAAMLMRYALHLGEGFGIVWNPGEPPVDGATDFLFMCCITLLYKAGLSVEHAVRILTFTAHLLTILLVYLMNRRHHGSTIFWASILAIYLILNPGIYFVGVYFGTTFFALWVLLSHYFCQKILLSEDLSYTTIAAFSGFGLIACLTRPEGILWILCSLIMILWKWKREGLFSIVSISKIKPAAKLFFLIYFLPALGYFLWHWIYFGTPLPNPLYRKGGGSIYPYSLIISIYLTGMLMLPLIPFFIWEWVSLKKPILSGYTIFPVGIFTVAFFFLSNEMNYGSRFQYCVLPVILISPLWRKEITFRLSLSERLKILKGSLPDLNLLIYGLLFYGFLIYPWVRYQRVMPVLRDEKYPAAAILTPFAGKGYTLATTEAGILPYYSRWKAIDTWGLNDKYIAHAGGVTQTYLDQYCPEVIMIDGAILPEKEREWSAMLDTLYQYVRNRPYTLAVHFYQPEPEFNHYYYVRNDFPDSDILIKSLRKLEYAGKRKRW